KGGDARNVRGQVSAKNSGSHSLLRNYRNVEERVPGPVISMGLGVDDVDAPAAPLDLPFQPHRIARLVRRVDQNEAIRSRHEAVIGALEPGLHENVSRKLFHSLTSFSDRRPFSIDERLSHHEDHEGHEEFKYPNS